MPLMTWNDRMSVGVRVLDDDHKKLVAMVNELYDGISAGKGQQALGGVLDKLISYTVVHFRREEDFFAKTGYPDSKAHMTEHENLTRQVLKVQENYRKGVTSSLSLEVMNFLKTWLISHIQGSDKKYGPHLNTKGVN